MMTSHQAYAFADGAYDDAELVLEVGLMQKAEEVGPDAFDDCVGGAAVGDVVLMTSWQDLRSDFWRERNFAGSRAAARRLCSRSRHCWAASPPTRRSTFPVRVEIYDLSTTKTCSGESARFVLTCQYETLSRVREKV